MGRNEVNGTSLIDYWPGIDWSKALLWEFFFSFFSPTLGIFSTVMMITQPLVPPPIVTRLTWRPSNRTVLCVVEYIGERKIGGTCMVEYVWWIVFHGEHLSPQLPAELLSHDWTVLAHIHEDRVHFPFWGILGIFGSLWNFTAFRCFKLRTSRRCKTLHPFTWLAHLPWPMAHEE